MEPSLVYGVKPQKGLVYGHSHERGKLLKKRWIFVKLKQYVDDFLLNPSNSNRFVVLSGLRGIGKTTLLMQLFEYLTLEKNVEKNSVLYISLDEIHSFLNKKLAEVISAYIEDELRSSPIRLTQKIFIFIDEAHFDKEWQVTLKALTDMSKNIFVIATGSSALLLGTSTDSARRISKEQLFPLNFSEYLTFKHETFFPPKGMSEDVRSVIYGDRKPFSIILNNQEETLSRLLTESKINFENDLYEYFELGGFAFTMNKGKSESYSKLMDIVDKVIKNDLPSFRNFESNILAKVFRLLGFIALKKTGEISHSKLADYLETSPDTVNSILETLEKTQLIFSIKPFHSSTGTKTWAGSPWKYYFLSPTMLYALRYTLGKGGFDEDTKAVLWENAVASTFFRLSNTRTRKTTLYYDRQEGGVDFLLLDNLTGKIIPVEVGLGKDKGQVEQAMKRFNSDFGVLISDFPKSHVQDNVIHIPFRTFLFA